MPQRPRLLVLASTFPARLDDGIPAFVLDLARQEAIDYEVTVLTPRVPGAPRRERMAGVDVERFAYFPRRWERLADGAILDNLRKTRSLWLQLPFLVLAQAIAVRRAIRRLRPDVIHAHWILPQGFSARLASRRIPLLVTLHGADVYALRSAPFRRMKRWVLDGAARVTTVNDQMATMIAAWGVDTRRTSTIPMGVPLDEVIAARRSAPPQAAGPAHLVVVGRLVEKKGFAVLLEALREHVTDRDWRLTIVGDGPERERLERLATGLPVTFTGQQGRHRVLAEIASCELFLLPSITAASGDQEGLPVVLLEAAALGTAIVAADLPGINEVVIDGVTGSLVPSGDAAALGAAIDRLLRDPVARASFAAAAAAVAQGYSTESIGARYRAVLDEARAAALTPVS
ncbi:glycosyltransferase [Galbitalea soli]|uniref:D-inositol 3-phosphate glycosyltransferase n=1 Tax=Galbitalea soli TaxID=1268042 RepID=A0A7C9PLA2_9MICO|nr:glycosyltransferase family 4 protein [Galbitalea soli]NYJ30797.1 glycosyltransferase involved in cell wall biosynthesis [Galbitalea soli]